MIYSHIKFHDNSWNSLYGIYNCNIYFLTIIFLYIKIGKKTNEDAILIKRLIKEGMKECQIAKKYNIRKQKVSYWKNHDIKTVIKRRSKLSDEDIQYMIKLAENKTTSDMGSRKITLLMNKQLEKEGKNLRISHMTTCRILNKNMGKPRKIKKVFSINNIKKEKRIKFCNKIKELGLNGKDIFFTDECIMDLSPFVNEKIRLSKENSEKLKKGDPEALNLVSKEAEKYPKQILIAGGISYYSLSDLIIVEGTMTDFAYGQNLLHYKKNFEEFKQKNKNLIFEQDRASTHTSHANTLLANTLFLAKIIGFYAPDFT